LRRELESGKWSSSGISPQLETQGRQCRVEVNNRTRWERLSPRNSIE
jgi:hypothetical protein